MGLFSNCNSVEDIKKRFRELVRDTHPDNGGDTKACARVLEEYRQALNEMKTFRKNIDNSARTYDNKEEGDGVELSGDLADVAAVLCGLDGVRVELCGAWLWISGNTYPHRATIKAVGAKWANNKKMWYFHEGEYKRRGKAKTIEEIRGKYGTASIKVDRVKRLGE